MGTPIQITVNSNSGEEGLLGQSERSDEGAERTPPQRSSPDEAGGMGAAAPIRNKKAKPTQK